MHTADSSAITQTPIQRSAETNKSFNTKEEEEGADAGGGGGGGGEGVGMERGRKGRVASEQSK